MLLMSWPRVLACLQPFSPRRIYTDFQRLSTAIPYIGYLANLLLLAAVGLGLYARWMHSEDIAVLLIAFLGLLMFASSCTLVHYFSMETIGYCLYSLWLGCLLGVVAFTTEHSLIEHESVKAIVETMDILFVSSLLLRSIWSIIQRACIQGFAVELASVNKMDSMEMVGMAIASLVTGHDFLSIALMLVGLSVITVTLRLKSFLGFLNLVVYIITLSLVYFPKMLVITANPFALACFLGRVTFEPFIDILSPLTVLQRWQPLTQKSPSKRRLIILGVVVVQIVFFVTCSVQIPNHKEWFVVVPMFGAFSIVWFLLHLVFFIVIWQLSNKLTECNSSISVLDSDRTLKRVMEAKGIRLFALISQRLAFVTMLTTVVIGGLHWTTKSGASLGLWFINIPLEIAVISLLWELGSVLGGTSIGYAILSPSAYAFQINGNKNLDVKQTFGTRVNRILNSLQNFFAYNFIDIHGCDYSPDGLTLASLESKVKTFMQRCTSDGPRYDSYVLYYSGPVHENGDWILAGDQRLCFQQLFEWWQQCDINTDTRLILILDTEFSFRWIRNVVHMKSHFFAIQSAILFSHGDPEDYLDLHVGDFTQEWTDYNSINSMNVAWKRPKRLLRPVFGISRPFPNFVFHLPNEEDIRHYWDSNFPRLTRPLLRIMNFPQITRMLCVCYCVMACLRRWKLMVFMPRSFDTGHGFILIR